jgi:hypothetical protein
MEVVDFNLFDSANFHRAHDSLMKIFYKFGKSFIFYKIEYRKILIYYSQTFQIQFACLSRLKVCSFTTFFFGFFNGMPYRHKFSPALVTLSGN